MNKRSIPIYFNKVQEQSLARWKKLDDDPVLAAPWHQLFKQVKSPHHVISELLQNADDAGATWVEVRIKDGHFFFIHNGDDFDENSFSSLCQFGYSNKRTLHTIGFRGLGFKSTFSLGKQVEVITPTLAVAFNEKRFTAPNWLTNAPNYPNTVIHIELENEHKKRFLEEEIKRWTSSLAPMLFFRNIKLLTLDGVQVKKDVEGEGPVLGSQWVKLITGSQVQRVLHVCSQELAFPSEAIDEIKKERGIIDEKLELPSVSVEIIFGLPMPQRLYVVLPTKAHLPLPFSINAPFVQDPARTGIKDPVLSPTNTWLLKQIGELGADIFHKWLGNRSLPIGTRVAAYELLPDPLVGVDVLGSSDSAEHILFSLQKKLDQLPNILTGNGELASEEKCLGAPKEFVEIWNLGEILSLFGTGQTQIIAAQVPNDIRERLKKWGWYKPLDTKEIIARLERPAYLPTLPFDSLILLWSFIAKHLKLWFPSPYERKNSLSKFAIVPLKDASHLFPVKNIIPPLGPKEKQFTDDEWKFLTHFFDVADEKWVEYISSRLEMNPDDAFANDAWALIKELGLDKTVAKETIINKVADFIFSQGIAVKSDRIRITHIAARLDVNLPPGMKFLCVDEKWHEPQQVYLPKVDRKLERILPTEWIETYSLHNAYFESIDPDFAKVLGSWLKKVLGSPRHCIAPKLAPQRISQRSILEGECKRLGGFLPTEFKYSTSSFILETYQFSKQFLDYWDQQAKDNPTQWSELVELILEDWNADWGNRTTSQINQQGNKYQHPLNAGSLVAEWVYSLRQKQCVLDNFSRPAFPSEVMCTTPETAHLQGIERFIHPTWDKPEYRKFLSLLGVRTSPADANKIIERLRVLSNLPGDATLREVMRLYEALERFVLNGSVAQVISIKETFKNEALLVSQERTWHKTDEIFQKNDDQIPGIPILHGDANFHTLWNRLGIPERPTFFSVLDWLSLLPFNKRLPDNDLARVRSILKRYGIQVWEQNRGWLNLDNEWLPADRIRWQIASPAIANSGLFSFARQVTANLTMLETPVNLSAQIPFLEQVLEYRLAQVYEVPNARRQPTWLPALARCIGRVQLSVPDEKQFLLAARLSKTKLQQVDKLEVVPYLENQPVADHQSLKALWKNEKLYIIEEGNMLFHEISDAIASHFPPELKQAIQDCCEREPHWIEAYFEEYFTLTPLEDLPIQVEVNEVPTTQEATTTLEVDAREAEAQDTEAKKIDPKTETAIEEAPSKGEADIGHIPNDGDTPSENATERPRPEKLSPKERVQAYFAVNGFSESFKEGSMHTAKGDRLQKSKDLFQWEVIDRGGFLKMRYWVGEKSLKDGVEIPAAVWELFKKHPERSRLLLPDGDGSFQEYNWKTINEMLQHKTVELLQSTYRLRKAEG